MTKKLIYYAFSLMFTLLFFTNYASAQQSFNPFNSEAEPVDQKIVTNDAQNKYLSRLSYSTPPFAAARLPIDENTKLYIMTILGIVAQPTIFSVKIDSRDETFIHY